MVWISLLVYNTFQCCLDVLEWPLTWFGISSLLAGSI